MGSSKINAWIGIFIGIIILLYFVADTIDDAQSAGDSLNASNRCAAEGGFYNGSTGFCDASSTVHTLLPGYADVPLSGLFGAGGVIILLIMAAVLLYIYRSIKMGK